MLESHTRSKTGHPGNDEDLVHLTRHHLVVIDGATSKTPRRWDGRTGGQLAASLTARAFDTLPSNATVHDAVHAATTVLRTHYEHEGVLSHVTRDPKQRAGAVFAAFSVARREVWLVGDCQALIGEERVSNEKLIDRVHAEVRALVLQHHLLRGVTTE